MVYQKFFVCAKKIQMEQRTLREQQDADYNKVIDKCPEAMLEILKARKQGRDDADAYQQLIMCLGKSACKPQLVTNYTACLELAAQGTGVLPEQKAACQTSFKDFERCLYREYPSMRPQLFMEKE